jgi:hypothetical protein
MLRFGALVLTLLLLASTVSLTQTITQSSPLATTVASQSLQAAAGTTSLTDATLQGRVNYTAGSDEDSGNFTLEVKGNQESKLALNLSSGQRGEIRQGQVGAWVDTAGVQHPMALHNCWMDASSLFPAFSVWGALNDPQVKAVYVEQTLKDGVTVDHLQLTRAIGGQTPDMTAESQNLSLVDLYLDAATHLPVALDYNTHPDNDLTLNIPVEVQFSGYQKLGGILVATHVQKLLQGTLTLDLYISSVTINSGLSDTEFSIQTVQGVSQ